MTVRGFKITASVSAENPVLGDLYLDGGDFATVDGAEATAQEIRTRLLLFRGHNFMDVREGVPWFQAVLRKGVSLARVREIVRSTILNAPAVVDVPRLDVALDRATRALSITYEARTIDGLTVRSEDYAPLLIEEG